MVLMADPSARLAAMSEAVLVKGDMVDVDELQAVLETTEDEIDRLLEEGANEEADQLIEMLEALEAHDPVLRKDIRLPQKVDTVLKPEDKASGMPSWLYLFLPALGRGSMPIGWLYIRVREATGLPAISVNGVVEFVAQPCF